MSDTTYNLNGGFKPTIKRSADLGGPDFFPTPPWATFALIDNEKFSGDIWECACGDGAMSRVLEQVGPTVYSSDLYKRGYGEAAERIQELFLANRRDEATLAVPDEYVDEEYLVGPKARIAERYKTWRDSGLTGLTLRLGPREVIDLMATLAID